MASATWWSERSANINGIFKGGGGKGVLYAGALRAVDERGYWFRACAGASAGAITATLIAAGLTVDQMEAAVPEALGRIKKNYAFDLVGKPFVRIEALSEWLDEQLRAQVTLFEQPTSESDVTFVELYDATGIELYIVSVDVALRQPVIFSAFTTPVMAVAQAAIASSAIPLAFRPGRLEYQRANGELVVHRLMDGGVWANYPAFIFKDPSFRSYEELPELPADTVTIGFTLQHAETEPPAEPTQIRTDWDNTGADRGSMLRGWLRLMPVRLYLFTLVPLVFVIQGLYTIGGDGLTFVRDLVFRYEPPVIILRVAAVFDGFFSSFYLGYLPAALILSAVALMLALVGATLIDSGIPTFKTLMAVGTNVPYWVGATEGDHVVRLHVPDGLGTFSLRFTPERLAEVINAAEVEATEQVATILPAYPTLPEAGPEPVEGQT
jgi:predicted acylesterase/phospholipase RssA